MGRVRGWLYGADAGVTDRRADIQGLRALAVTAVLVNHVWPAQLPGGYVGVDVFFVVSGFLITSHLLKELTRSDRIDLRQFYARRIRRLLPAAFLVLIVSGVMVRLVLQYPRWVRNGAEIAASALYVENWFLAARSVNYSALNDAASVSQHYWSLSVEEQFYLLWPVLLLALWWLARKTSLSRIGTTVAGMAVVVVGSMGLSVWWTAWNPASAYFATPVRFWEFGLGALLALVMVVVAASTRRSGPAEVLCQLLAIIGFAMVVWSAWSYSAVTAFPGWRALVPALGTALVILTGGLGTTMWHSVVTSLRPVQYVGDISYSLYLWHWPIVVLAPFVLGKTVGPWDKVGIALLAVVLAGLTKAFVEDPCRRLPWLQERSRRTYVSMLAGMALIGVACSALVVNERMIESAPVVNLSADTVPTCVGPYALLDADQCPDVVGPSDDPIMTESANAYWAVPDDPQCSDVTRVLGRTDRVCDYSTGADPVKVLLIGDSHAQQWQYAILPLAKKYQWNLVMTYDGACPTVDSGYVGYRGTPATADKVTECTTWREAERDYAAQDGTSIVFISFFGREEQIDDGTGRPQMDQYVDGLTSYAQPFLASGADVYVLGDPPMNSAVRDPDCVILHQRDPAFCAVPRDIAQPPDPMLEAADASQGTIVGIDTTDLFCDQARCYAVVGGVTVYYDADHLNRQYVALLSPAIEDQLRRR
ncbi:MAG: acyltransferase [Propionibacteriaceae bacterium]|nr:acyltransferase [Propionibacteriaceae bacterium]